MPKPRIALVLGMSLVLGACAKSEERPAADTGAVTITPTISLASLAGTWNMRSLADQGDSTIATYDLVATADETGWMMHVPNRPPIPVRVSSGGDSIVTEAGPFESTIRMGTQVTIRSVLRLEGSKLVGTTVASFAGAGPDSSLHTRAEGTRAQ